jgi:hypothetical protein
MSEEDNNILYGISILIVVCCIFGFLGDGIEIAFKVIGALASAAALVYIVETTWKKAFKKEKKSDD